MSDWPNVPLLARKPISVGESLMVIGVRRAACRDWHLYRSPTPSIRGAFLGGDGRWCGCGNEAKACTPGSNLGQIWQSPLVLDRIASSWARVALAEGDVASAGRWRDNFERTHCDGVTTSQRHEWHTAALVHLAEGTTSSDIELLGQLQARSTEQERGWDEIVAGVDLVRAFNAQGERARAKQELARLLRIAQPEGFVRSFVHGGQAVRNLLEQLHDERKQQGFDSSPMVTAQATYMRQILAAFRPVEELSGGPCWSPRS